jgi:hypothetical protein
MKRRIAYSTVPAAIALAVASQTFGQLSTDPGVGQISGNPRGRPVLPIPEDLPSGSGGGTDGPGSYDLTWYTIDGGGATYLTGGAYSLGATAGQPDAGFMSGGSFELGGGFWYGAISNPCYANCDHSTTPPVLNVLDFACFLNAFASGDTYANCDHSTTPPVLNVLDFACFLNAFAAGCS